MASEAKQFRLRHDRLVDCLTSLAMTFLGLYRLRLVRSLAHNALDLDDEDWRKAFWESWGELEISYALGLDRPLEPMDEVSVKLVWEAVADLDSLVAAKLP